MVVPGYARGPWVRLWRPVSCSPTMRAEDAREWSGPRYQRGARGQCVRADESVVRVTRPAKTDCRLADERRWRIRRRQLERRCQLVNHAPHWNLQPPDFVKVLQLQLDERGQPQRLIVEPPPDCVGDESLWILVEPDHHVRIEEEHGRHSPDQSTWTRSFGSPTIVPGWPERRASLSGASTGSMRSRRPPRSRASPRPPAAGGEPAPVP